MHFLTIAFWLAFGVIVAFIAWELLRMLLGIPRRPPRGLRAGEPHRKETGGITGDTADVSSGDSGFGDSSGGG